jgi:hypothetical protein
MSYLNRMYGSRPAVTNTVDKNPNRVVGGLKGHGADHYTMLGEDGSEQKIPTHKYVQALEEKLRIQDRRIDILERKLKSVSNDQRLVIQNINRKNSN